MTVLAATCAGLAVVQLGVAVPDGLAAGDRVQHPLEARIAFVQAQGVVAGHALGDELLQLALAAFMALVQHHHRVVGAQVGQRVRRVNHNAVRPVAGHQLEQRFKLALAAHIHKNDRSGRIGKQGGKLWLVDLHFFFF